MCQLRNKILLFFCFVFSGVFCMAGTTLTLKSARSVTAEITENKNKKSVQVFVRFIPVSSLDPLNNERMNYGISRFFVEQALSQFYGKEKSVNFSGIRPVLNQSEKQKKTFCYLVPYTAISDAIVKKEPYTARIAAGYSHSSDSDVFLSALEIFNRDLMLAESFFLRKIQNKEDKKDLEKDINSAFDALKEKIDNQDDLLSAEKEDFISKIDKVRRYLLKKNQKISAPSHSASQTSADVNLSSTISNYNFHPEFKKLLLSDILLLESGGCRAFSLPDGRIALIGVGMAEVKNSSAKDRLIRQKIAEQRAFAALAEHEEVNVTSFSQLSDSATITTVDKKENAKDQRAISTMSTVRAEAYFTNMLTVGQWYSKNGKIFYLAKGCMIPSK